MYEIEEIIAAAGSGEDGYPDEDLEELSWFLEPGAAEKKSDRLVFLYRETGIPPAVQEFFGAGDLSPGEKRQLVLWHDSSRFGAYIEKTVHAQPRTRMIWKPDFAAVLRKAYPAWMEFFAKSRQDFSDTPTLRFTPGREPGHFEVAFLGAPSKEASAEFTLPVQPGETIDHDALQAIFRCSGTGAVRRSPATNGLVLISDHTQSPFEDKWIGKSFHFTGPGTADEQDLSHPHNKLIAESKESGLRLWLFEVFCEGHYLFIGEAYLADSPYRSRQPDQERNLCDVWIFPLKLMGKKHPPLIKKELIASKEEARKQKMKKMPFDELEFQARYALKEGGRREVVMEVYEHDQLVSEFALRMAGGTCQLCDEPAPFATKDGEPYLEVHHVVPRTDGGPDEIGNVVALCPNCHRRVHLLQLPDDLAKLRSIAAKHA